MPTIAVKDTIKTRMQLRRQSATLEAIQARSSLAEPALRLQHSLVEPLAFIKRGGSFAEPTTNGMLQKSRVHEPSLRMVASATTTVPVKANTYSSSSTKGVITAPMGPWGTATRIVKREGFFALYKGLSAVYTGIIPKMAIRFVSFEQYKIVLGDVIGPGNTCTFFAGLLSGLTEAVIVVTPAEVCKIRMQSQYNSLVDPSQMANRKYTNVVQTSITIVREEGIGALYKGVVPTMLRQGCNQAVNFTAYQFFKKKLMEYQGTSDLQHWQSMLLGGLSGGMGPLVNNPLGENCSMLISSPYFCPCCFDSQI
jgi:Mitochondrial carrier protein